MNARNCKLCREEGKELRNSHLLAKGALSVGFPSDVVIHVTVCTDFASQGSCCVPSRVPENPHTTYALLTQGVYFRVLTAKDPPVVLRSSFEWLDAIELLAAVETRQERTGAEP